MKALLFVFTALMLLFSACVEDEPSTIVSSIDGQLLVHGTGLPDVFPAGSRPVVELYELVYVHTGDIINPSPTYKLILQSQEVDGTGKFSMDATLARKGEYYLQVSQMDTLIFLGAMKKRVEFVAAQTLNPEMLAVSWVTPRFVNQTNLPGDIFSYTTGIGGIEGVTVPPFAGYVDTTMTWVYRTWGGPATSVYDKHVVYGLLTRDGVQRDTAIYYAVPPGDTTVVTIAW